MDSEEELFLKEQELRELYYDPVRGYQSAQKLYEAAKEEGVRVTLAQVREWLEEQKHTKGFNNPPKILNEDKRGFPKQVLNFKWILSTCPSTKGKTRTTVGSQPPLISFQGTFLQFPCKGSTRTLLWLPLEECWSNTKKGLVNYRTSFNLTTEESFEIPACFPF